jgi:uncharacterized protein YndB with AHSA1/START domain
VVQPVIRSERRHHFDAAPDEVWTAMSRTGAYRSWWPWLRRLDDASFTVGSRWACEVQPPLPYTVRFTLLLDEIEPDRFVTATISGDIVGSAAVDLTPTITAAGTGIGTELRLVAALAPDQAVLRTVARFARPVVRLGHDWVLDTGFRQFRRRALDARGLEPDANG